MKDLVKKNLSLLFEKITNQKPESIEILPQSGSDRIYFRIQKSSISYIGAYNQNVSENEAFFSFTKTFHDLNINVPRVHAISICRKYYLVTDLGNTTLYDIILKQTNESTNKESLCFMKLALQGLIEMQIHGSEHIDFSKSYPRAEFDKQSISWDLQYFKYLFLKPAAIAFDEQKLETDFDTLIGSLLQVPSQYFMYRDFQSRNIMINDNNVWFIDYQGGRKGPLQYDVASLLFSPKSKLNSVQREVFLNFYLDKLQEKIEINRSEFVQIFYLFALVRILQALGAYGFRGIIENKPGFKENISTAIQNIEYLFSNNLIGVKLPQIEAIVHLLKKSEYAKLYSLLPDKLTVRVTSFSYKNGIPPDASENGGGFVFDCRGLPNPGRLHEYRNKNGTQKQVIDYLEKYDEVKQFQNMVQGIVKISIEEYIRRGFQHLCVNFGCTGGQHRSVYNAQKFAQWVQNNYAVKVVLHHIEIEKSNNEQNQM